MWGRAGQIIATVIALVLLYPARSVLHAQASLPAFISPGRAFASLPDEQPSTPTTQRVQAHTFQSYVRRASHEYITPAKRTALIIGINHARGTQSLPGSVTDATNLRRALLGYGFRDENITLLLDGAATRSAILDGLRALAQRTPTSGLAVFAIATHTKRSRGTNLLATADGGRISAGELASHLRAVQAPAWIALPTCYAGGYALPGIVGFNRIATFASSADQPSYQAGSAGSFLFVHMVQRAMNEGLAPASVETAFEFARRELERDHPQFVPSIADGYPGDLVLGPRAQRPKRDDAMRETDGGTQSAYGNAPSYRTYEAEPSPTPEPRRRRGVVGVCGSIRYNC